MGLGDAALAGVAGRDRQPKPLRDSSKRVMRVGLVDPVAHEQDRPAGTGDGPDDGFGIGRRRRGPRERRREHLVEGRRPAVVGDLLLEQVVGDAQVDRTRRADDRMPGRLANEPRDVAHHRRLDTPLGHRGEQVWLLELLVLLAIPIGAAHRRDQGHDRAAGPIRLGQRAGHVGGTRTVRAIHEGRRALDTGIAIRHVDRRRLAPGEDLADADRLEGDPEPVVPAGHQEEVLDSERLELIGDGRRCLGGDGFIRGADRAGKRGQLRSGRGDNRVPLLSASADAVITDPGAPRAETAISACRESSVNGPRVSTR